MEATNVITLPVIQNDGPPCLDHTRTKQYDESLGSNKKDMAYALGLLHKSRNPDTWEPVWEEAIDRYFPERMALNDRVAVRDKIAKAVFPREAYPCNKLAVLCNESECTKRKHGSLKAIRVKLPDKLQLWRESFYVAHYGDTKIEIDADKLNPKTWQIKMMGKGIWTDKPTQKEWDVHMMRLFQSMEIIDVPDEDTPSGYFYQWFLDWLTENMVFVERVDDKSYRWSHNPWIHGYDNTESGSPFNDMIFKGNRTGIKIDDRVYFDSKALRHAITRDRTIKELGYEFSKLWWFLREQFAVTPRPLRRNLTRTGGGQKRVYLWEIPYTQAIEDNISKEAWVHPDEGLPTDF